MDPITPRTTGARDLSDAGIRLRPPAVARVRPRTIAPRPLGRASTTPTATPATPEPAAPAVRAERPASAAEPVLPPRRGDGLDLDAWGTRSASRAATADAPRPAPTPAPRSVPTMPGDAAAGRGPTRRTRPVPATRRPRPAASVRAPGPEPLPALPPQSSWIVPDDSAAPAAELQSSWTVPAVPTVAGTVVRPTGSRRRPQARTTGRRERGATAPPSTRPARARGGSTHPTGRVPDDLVDALGHLDRQRSAVPTVYIDDYALDKYGVEQIGQQDNEVLPTGRHAREEGRRQRPVLWPAVLLVVLVAVLAVLLSVL